jgi:hypothetical protein
MLKIIIQQWFTGVIPLVVNAPVVKTATGKPFIKLSDSGRYEN